MIAGERVFVIAEAGVNHNGSLNIGMELVEAAAEAGADAVKFQTFKSDKVVAVHAPKAEYQNRTINPGQSQLEMLRGLELDESMHHALRDRCRARGIEFMSTAFDLGSLATVIRVGVNRLKISSGEIASGPLLLSAARTGLPVILSTGVCGLADVETALGVLAFGYLGWTEHPSLRAFACAYASPEGHAALREKVTLLHCTTEYPAPPAESNLRAMETLFRAFGLPVGYSDHSIGISIPMAAAALGAVVVEKHFTVDRGLPGPDHQASLEPGELAGMVQGIRDVEKALGDGRKVPAPTETKNLDVIRKSLVAARDIAAGEVFSEDNLAFKRPGGGISPLRYWEWLGRPAERSYQADERIRQ